jgi:hypothetical protein
LTGRSSDCREPRSLVPVDDREIVKRRFRDP